MATFKDSVKSKMDQLLTKENMIGEYDYTAMCMPNLPCMGLKKEKQKVHFFATEEVLPFFLAMLMGLQHAFAMVGGIITPPFVVMKFTVADSVVDPSDQEIAIQQYAISAALIVSGLCTLLNVIQIEIPYSEAVFGKKLVVGTGVLSVMGTSFTFLPIFEIAIGTMKNDGITGNEAYGKMLGTVLVCSFLEAFFSFIPANRLKRVFPPIVTGITVLLIGATLCGTGMKYWGGGAVCAEEGWKLNSQVVNSVGFGKAVFPIPSPICQNGEVALAYGSPQYIGLGFSVLVMLVIIEMVGSAFMKNCNVIIALLFGFFVAGVSRYHDEGESFQYVTDEKIIDADWITFLWVYTFPIGFYAPAVLPLLVCYIVTTVETIGDIGATFEASELSVEGDRYNTSVQGGLLADAVSSFFSALATSMPNTTFSQNNGVIAMTKCASRSAGVACGCWLLFFGIIGKFAGIITSIPDCVLGGMTIFLFTNVFVSGLSILSKVDLKSRRNRFITVMSTAVGLGVIIWPWAFQDMRASPYTAQFWTCSQCNDTEKGARNAVMIFLSTGYCIGTVIAIILNTILPEDVEVLYSESTKRMKLVPDDEDEVSAKEVEIVSIKVQSSEVDVDA